MSGTSLDGIDATVIETDGVSVKKRYGGIASSYQNSFKQKIHDIIKGKGDISAVEEELTSLHAGAVSALLKHCSLTKDDIDVIGFHGQTIDHRPDEGITVQIGDGKLLAELTGIDVVNNFRINDVKNGGQGAPLVPVYHQALALGHELPVAIVNIGGVANVTFIGETGDLIAFDTGPGNALIDDWVFAHTGNSYDENGLIAAAGKTDNKILDKLLAHKYFVQRPPKSLDRNEFAGDFLSSLSLEDGAATLTDFTAKTISIAAQHFPEKPKTYYIAGGGRHNKYLMQKIAGYLHGAKIETIDSLGYDGDMLEAEAFAFLAVRSLKKLPLTFPATTGVKEAVSGGVFYSK